MSSSSLRGKIARKRYNAKKEGLQFLLSENDIRALLLKAGIAVGDWSFYGYHLARFNDSGHYVLGNCRFVLATDNYQEHRTTKRQREASVENIKKARSVFANKTAAERSEIGRKGGRISQTVKPSLPLSEAELISRYQHIRHLDKGRWGFRTRAAKVLGVTPQYVGRLVRKWEALGV